MEKFYEYESNFYTDGRSEKFVCQGRKSFIEKFVVQKELSKLFGGFVLSEDVESGEEFIGVWGKRKCQKFRRILRERGAEFMLANDHLPNLRRIMESRCNQNLFQS